MRLLSFLQVSEFIYYRKIRLKCKNNRMLNQTFSQRLNDKAETRPVNFGKTIVVATVSLPQNVYDGNYNWFLQHFSLNAIVSEPFWGIKGTTREDLFIRMTIFFQKHKSQALVVGLVHHIPLFYVVLFTGSQLSDRSDSHRGVESTGITISFSFFSHPVPERKYTFEHSRMMEL